jgi:hypothetical protein
MFDNSPAFQRRDTRKMRIVPKGRLTRAAFSRPCGIGPLFMLNPALKRRTILTASLRDETLRGREK